MDSVSQKSDNSGKWIINEILQFTEQSPKNSITGKGGERAFDPPLVGFARGTDPLFDELKKDIGEFFWTPLEIFQKSFPDENVLAEELTVISWVLPQTKITRKDHAQAKDLPSERWSRVRHYGEKFNDQLRLHMENWLGSKDIPAVSPVQAPDWSRMESEKYGYASKWSERHVAYVAGLGTFSLSDGFITSAGMAMRLGSTVARISIQPSVREFDSHLSNCLFYTKGNCKACIKRCPVDAITEEGHDKVKCQDYIREITSKYVEEQLGFWVSSCGLCQTKVPCESCIPKNCFPE